MFPDKHRMVHQANILLLMLGISPAVYIVVAAPVVFGRSGFARNLEIILPILLGLIAVSVVNIGVLAFTQTNQRFLEKMVKEQPCWRDIPRSLNRRDTVGGAGSVRLGRGSSFGLNNLRSRILPSDLGMSHLGER